MPRDAATPVPTATREPEPGSLHARAAAAVLTCIARHGLAKTTLDDVAREAGCARATLYRYFPSKRHLVDAALTIEATRLLHHLRAVAGEAETLEDAIVATFTTTARAATDHPALHFVVAHERELLLPHLAFDSGSRFLRGAGAALADVLADHLPRPTGSASAERAGEWLARVLLVHLAHAGSPVDMTDELAVRSLVRDFVLPGLVPEPSVPVRG